jgi:hypothetical protein
MNGITGREFAFTELQCRDLATSVEDFSAGRRITVLVILDIFTTAEMCVKRTFVDVMKYIPWVIVFIRDLGASPVIRQFFQQSFVESQTCSDLVRRMSSGRASTTVRLNCQNNVTCTLVA